MISARIGETPLRLDEASCSPSRPRRGRSLCPCGEISTAVSTGLCTPPATPSEGLIRSSNRPRRRRAGRWPGTRACRPRRGASARAAGDLVRARELGVHGDLDGPEPALFVASSLLTIFAAPHSKSFHPAVVRTCEPRSAARAPARGPRAGVTPGASERAGSAERARAAHRQPAPRRRERARPRGGGRSWRAGGTEGRRGRERRRAREEVRRTRRTGAGAAAEDAVAKESVVQQVHRRHPRVDRFNCRGRRCAGICCQLARLLLTSAAHPGHFQARTTRTEDPGEEKNTGRHPSRTVARRVSPSPRASPRLPPNDARPSPRLPVRGVSVPRRGRRAAVALPERGLPASTATPRPRRAPGRSPSPSPPPPRLRRGRPRARGRRRRRPHAEDGATRTRRNRPCSSSA